MIKVLAKVMWIGLGAVVLFTPVFARAQDLDEVKVAKIKSAYVLNFMRFTKWPDESFVAPDSPMVIGVIGRDTLGKILDQTFYRELIRGRAIEIVRVTDGAETGVHGRSGDTDRLGVETILERVRGCHLLFVSRSEEDRVRTILAGVDGLNVLTVSDLPGFARYGGMIELTLRKGRIVFDVNPGAMSRARVTISSKILRLAGIVRTEGGEGS